MIVFVPWDLGSYTAQRVSKADAYTWVTVFKYAAKSTVAVTHLLSHPTCTLKHRWRQLRRIELHRIPPAGSKGETRE